MKFSRSWWIAVLPILLLIILVYFFVDIVTYIVLAWVLSMVLGPLHRLFNKYVKSSSIAALMCIVATVVVFVLYFFLIIPPLATQAKVITKVDYNALFESLDEPINDVSFWLEDKGIVLFSHADEVVAVEKEAPISAQVFKLDSLLGADTMALRQNVAIVINVDNEMSKAESLAIEVLSPKEQLLSSFKDKILTFINPEAITSWIGNIVGFFSDFLIMMMSVLFITFFFLKEETLFQDILYSFVPNEKESKVGNALAGSKKLIVRYFIGILAQMLCVIVILWVVLSILGVENALLIAFFGSIMNVIPFIGPILGALIGVLITISSNVDLPFYDETMPLIFKVLAAFATMQLIDNFLLQPNIFSKSVKAHPLEIFVIILMFGKVWGVLGMVLAIPAYTVLRVLAKVFLSEYKLVQKLTGGL